MRITIFGSFQRPTNHKRGGDDVHPTRCRETYTHIQKITKGNNHKTYNILPDLDLEPFPHNNCDLV